MAEQIKGIEGLAKKLMVNRVTIRRWMDEGILDEAIVIKVKRTTVFDYDAVKKCLNRKSILKKYIK